MSFLCLLASIVSDEKSAINHIFVPCCVMSRFTLAAYVTSALSLVVYFLIENRLEDLVEIKFSFSDFIRKVGSGTRK